MWAEMHSLNLHPSPYKNRNIKTLGGFFPQNVISSMKEYEVEVGEEEVGD